MAGDYLEILASCAVQHPPVTFTDDCQLRTEFDKKLHAEPIDGGAAMGECMVIFPALMVKREGEAGQWEAVNKRFVLGQHEQEES